MKKALHLYFLLLRLFAGPQFALEIIRTGRRGIFLGAIMLPITHHAGVDRGTQGEDGPELRVQ